ncbi:peptide chain release factor 1-like, mitochondrial isoform X2 [Fopius arisanus]|uniref:Peptide chain release factor 1-like, mitochondrial isoform X2 n=1 Tax=Fopius arisanus TaxID=64838 RepID=A0A9R1U4B0_9HYME|nr:PREDICTED: peptide chain release factor 1-like, mitochondrial isoform X2 [Fopius arisanus]
MGVFSIDLMQNIKFSILSMMFLFRNIKFGICDVQNFGNARGQFRGIISNLKTGVHVNKKYNTGAELPVSEVREVVNMLEDRLKIEENIMNLNDLATESKEMSKLISEEQHMYRSQLTELDDELLKLILTNVGRDNCRSIVFEITAGVGGSEAMIFTGDLLAMYQSYFSRLGYSQELVDISSEGSISGIRHASVLVSGDRVFETLRHEGGVHRVQRIPATEKNGRIHTSTATVAVLPELNDIEVNIRQKDLKIETKKATGAGGQHVNTTDSAVRITHIPTGIVVEAQTDRSQIRNRKTAMLKLRKKMYEEEFNKQRVTTGSLRKEQRGMSTRNEKIRTYNYSQDRITDHRISGGTLHNLKGFMANGEGLEELHEKLQRQLQLKIFQRAIERWK